MFVKPRSDRVTVPINRAVFVEVFYAGHGATKAEAKAEWGRRGGSPASFYRAWNWAVEDGRIARVEGRQSYRWVTADSM